MVTPGEIEIDALLARAVGGRDAEYPGAWVAPAAIDRLLDRISYHGVAVLLAENAVVLDRWPAEVGERVRERALAQSMWEVRHRALLCDLLGRLEGRGIASMFLKGTAMAYDLYDNPAARARGDSDLLVEERAVGAARECLVQAGFVLLGDSDGLPQSLRLQESWSTDAGDGSNQVIDLHWHPLNTPALDLLSFSQWERQSRPLPRLHPAARAPSRPLMLVHACVHRGLHVYSPYLANGRMHFGGNRLIWLRDIACLARTMDDAQWASVTKLALDRGLSAVCLDGIVAAEAHFGALVPAGARAKLGSGPSAAYFRSGQLGRALRDFWAIRGLGRKLQYVSGRSFPAAGFMRAKYGDMATRPLPFLYLRRFAELVQRRPSRTSR